MRFPPEPQTSPLPDEPLTGTAIIGAAAHARPRPPNKAGPAVRSPSVTDTVQLQFREPQAGLSDCNFNSVIPDNKVRLGTDATNVQDQDGAELPDADEPRLRELTELARTGGVQLTGEGGLLGKLTRWSSRTRWRAS